MLQRQHHNDTHRQQQVVVWVHVLVGLTWQLHHTTSRAPSAHPRMKCVLLQTGLILGIVFVILRSLGAVPVAVKNLEEEAVGLGLASPLSGWKRQART
mmetsp:Transcript_72038/g.169549  ORF Transcript_72038/g.169549 Transcript_72038/m.169549 type:complete len:98 (-) Transcript_72038:182-475(-)